MTDNQDTKLNFVKVEATGFQSICDRLAELEKENEALTARNEFLERMVNGIKLNNSKLTQERNAYLDELMAIKNMSMFEFGNKYCNAESLSNDAKAFARALGVGQ